MTNSLSWRIWLVLCLLLCTGCSQNSLLTRQDYQQSQQDFILGDNEKALEDFPRGREQGDFITAMEKGYLSLLQGKPRLADLQQQARFQENKVRYHVSREARTFFYVRTPEDYYPSEHEVIWMHLLLGWGYAQQGKYTDACVEARNAGSLLTLPWSPQGHFDDPVLRLFLAGLWTMCGQWAEARVDLRAAADMDRSLSWAMKLAERDQPPTQLFIVVGGPGPTVQWDPKFMANLLRASRRVSFQLRGRKSVLTITDGNGAVIPNHLSPDASPWYLRHLERESELDELIQDSAFGGKAAATAGVAGAKTMGRVVQHTLIGAIAGAASVVYVLARAGVPSEMITGEVITGGAVLGAIIGAGYGAVVGVEEAGDYMASEMDPGKYYRFVRFLPEYLWLGWSDVPVAYPVRFAVPGGSVEVQQAGVVNGSAAVTIAQLADSKQQPLCRYRDERSSTTILGYPDKTGKCPPQPEL